MNVSKPWLQSLTKDEIAAACLEAHYAALPQKQLKEQFVEHAAGHVCLHHLSNHALEKLCKLEDIVAYKGKPKAQLIQLLQGSDTKVPKVPKVQTGVTAVQLDVFSAFSNLSLAPPSSSSSSSHSSSSLVSPERLAVLVPQRLEDLCRARVLPAHGSKAELVGSLHQDRVSLEELSKSELKALCAAEALPISGTCATLIARLQANSNTSSAPPPKQQAVQQQQLDRQKAVEQEGGLLQSGRKMSRNQYATFLRQAGLLEADQDVFHIIASANGGADHTHNYHFAQNQSWNRAIGSQHDFINCYVAGKIKAEKAVTISRSLGNGSINYTGPDALTLYKMGEDIMRTMRREHRNDWVNLMQARA